MRILWALGALLVCWLGFMVMDIDTMRDLGITAQGIAGVIIVALGTLVFLSALAGRRKK